MAPWFKTKKHWYLTNFLSTLLMQTFFNELWISFCYKIVEWDKGLNELRKALKLNLTTLVTAQQHYFQMYQITLQERNLSERKARPPYTYRNCSVACFIKVTLSAGVQIEPSVLHSIRDHAVILLQIVLSNPFACQSRWCGGGEFGPWPETKARPERPSPLSKTFFTCADSSLGLLLALPFERKGKGLWSQKGYLVIKTGLLNFTLKKKKGSHKIAV